MEPGGWDGILHFVGGDAGIGSPAPVPSQGSGGSSADLPMPRYRVAVMRDGAKCWLPWMRGQVDEGGSDDCFADERARVRAARQRGRPAWGKWEHDDDDGGAGNDVDQLDMIELTICTM